MQKARTTRWVEKRNEILTAGRLILNRDGLTGLSLSTVAKETGLQRPSIAYYFGNVEELAEALYEVALHELEQHVEAAMDAATPRERVAKLLDHELEYLARERAGEAIRRPQLGEIRALSGDRRRRLGRRYVDLVARVSRLLGVDAEGKTWMHQIGPAHILMESIYWIPAWIEEYEAWMFPRVRDAMVSTLFDGYRDRPHTRPAPQMSSLHAHTTSGVVDREAYLRTASRLICSHGVKGIGIDRIAAELNVTKGSFYHHHDVKEDLIEACFVHSELRLARLQYEVSQQCEPPHDAVSSVIAGLVTNQLEGRFPLLRTSALPSLDATARSKIIAKARRSFRWFASEISAAVQNGDAHSIDPFVTAQMIGATANAVYDLGRHFGDRIGANDAECFTMMLECGLDISTRD